MKLLFLLLFYCYFLLDQTIFENFVQPLGLLSVSEAGGRETWCVRQFDTA